MHRTIRRTLVGLAAGSVMLLSTAGAASASQQALPSASAAVVVKETITRKVVVHTSYPTDPTPTSKWTASIQGETVDTNGNGTADSLRSRADVRESFGITRARIYDIKTQANINHQWVTVQQNSVDAVSEANPAYAVSYSPTSKFCTANPGLRRTYRLVTSHGVRRDDNIVANRILHSSYFGARALANDPACKVTTPPPPPPKPAPDADLEIDVQGATVLQRGQVQDLDVIVTNNGPKTAGNATAIVDFNHPADPNEPFGLRVVNVDPRCVPRLSSSDPNDYICDLGLFGNGESENLDFDVRGQVAGDQLVKVWVSGSVAHADTDSDLLPITVIKSADLSLNKELVEIGDRVDGDRDPITEGYQVYDGDRIGYRFRIRNNGPDVATNVVLTDNWPAALSSNLDWNVYGGTCTRTPADELVCELGDLEVGGTDIITVYANASAALGTRVINTATVEGNEADPDSADRTDSVTFRVIAGHDLLDERPAAKGGEAA